MIKDWTESKNFSAFRHITYNICYSLRNIYIYVDDVNSSTSVIPYRCLTSIFVTDTHV